jgi:hypothetical protein
MHIYRYGTIMRPPGPGAVPRRGLIETHGGHFNAPSGHFCWGLAEYDRPLTDEEVSAYELEYITEYDMRAPDDN